MNYKRNIVSTLLSLSFIAILVIITMPIIPTSASPGVINVPGEQPTIQAAINAATSGDTIIVAAGSYTGAVVNKSLTIQGASGGASIITSGPHYGGGHPTAKTAFRLDTGSNGTTIMISRLNVM